VRPSGRTRLLAALESHLAAHFAVLVTCDLLAALFDYTAHPSTSPSIMTLFANIPHRHNPGESGGRHKGTRLTRHDTAPQVPEVALPTEPGTYVLVLWMATPHSLAVGRRMRGDFEAGYYLYVGSALCGLRARLQRYLTGPSHLHWHIDYVLGAASLAEIWYRISLESLECVWATRLAQSEAVLPSSVPFGASDCHCRTHLFLAGKRPTPEILGDDALQVISVSEAMPATPDYSLRSRRH